MDIQSFCLNSQVSQLVGRSIIISGIARSGTTILGKLVHSLRKVEYLQDPPLLISLIPTIHTFPEHTWRLLFETYVFEDFLIDALAGRRINLNRHDNSSIFQAKPESEIEDRLSRSLRKQDAFQQSMECNVAFKIVAITPFLLRIQHYYPLVRVIITLRRPENVLASLLRHEWFSDTSLRNFVRVWPSRVGHDICIPFWVPEVEIEHWLNASEVERCCMYYTLIYEPVLSLENSRIIDYDYFINDPELTIKKLSADLGLTFGEKTAPIISSVSYQSTSSCFDMGQIPVFWRSRVKEIYETVRALPNVLR